MLTYLRCHKGRKGQARAVTVCLGIRCRYLRQVDDRWICAYKTKAQKLIDERRVKDGNI